MFDIGLQEFDALSGALDGLVDVDPLDYTDGQTHRTFMELQVQMARLAAVTLKFGASWDARRNWAENGSKSAEARLARDSRIRRSTASRLLKRATALASMPRTAQALGRGEITLDHVDLLMHANAQTRWRCTRFADDEEMLVGYCRRMSFFDADREIRYWINLVDAQLDDDGPEPTYRDRQATTGRGIGNEVHLQAILDPVGGGEFLEALDRIEHDLYLDDNKSGNERTNTQRRADALVEMARRAMAAPPDTRQPRPLISVVMGDASFRWLCELSDGTIITPKALLSYLSSADVEGVLFDGPFHGVGVSSQRTFTGVLPRSSRSATDTANAHPGATSRCRSATSTTSFPTVRVGSPAKKTASWNARATTGTASCTGSDPPTTPSTTTTRCRSPYEPASPSCTDNRKPGKPPVPPPATESAPQTVAGCRRSVGCLGQGARLIGCTTAWMGYRLVMDITRNDDGSLTVPVPPVRDEGDEGEGDDSLDDLRLTTVVLRPGEGGYTEALAQWDLQQDPTRGEAVSTESGRAQAMAVVHAVAEDPEHLAEAVEALEDPDASAQALRHVLVGGIPSVQAFAAEVAEAEGGEELPHHKASKFIGEVLAEIDTPSE